MELPTRLFRTPIDGGTGAEENYGLNSRYLTRILVQQDQSNFTKLYKRITGISPPGKIQGVTDKANMDTYGEAQGVIFQQKLKW